jgi:hypothetical protein
MFTLRPGDQDEHLRADAIPSPLLHAHVRGHSAREQLGAYHDANPTSVCERVPYSEASQSARLRLLLARARLPPFVRVENVAGERPSGPAAALQVLEHVRYAAQSADQVFGALLAQHRSHPVDHAAVQGQLEAFPGVAARLSRVFVQLSLPVLRCHTAQLHSAKKSGLERFSKMHETARPVNAQLESDYHLLFLGLFMIEIVFTKKS